MFNKMFKHIIMFKKLRKNNQQMVLGSLIRTCYLIGKLDNQDSTRRNPIKIVSEKIKSYELDRSFISNL